MVTCFDHEKGIVQVKRKDVHYFTKARSNKSTTIIEQTGACWVNHTKIGFGRLKIVEQVTGYDRRLVANQKSIGIVPLDLPKLEFETEGLWVEIPDHVRDKIESDRMHFMGGIHALEHAAIGIMPLLVMTDRNDLGGISIPFHSQIGKAAVFVYDGVPGGLGLSRQAFENPKMLLERTFETINACPCETGCPACVHSPKCGSGNRPIDKTSALRMLEMMLLENSARENQTIEGPINEGPINEGPTRESLANGDGWTALCHQTEVDPLISKKTIRMSSDMKETKKGDLMPEKIRYGVLDIETRRSAKEVGGWNKASKMGVSCAILYDSKTDCFQEYLQKDMEKLLSDLQQCDLIIGFNIIKFDYKVLSGLLDFNFHKLPTLDLLVKVHERLGYRLSLDHLAGQTLGVKKSADGLQALEWWQQGEIKKLFLIANRMSGLPGICICLEKTINI